MILTSTRGRPKKTVERAVMTEYKVRTKSYEKCYIHIAAFEDGKEGHSPRKAGSLWKLTKARSLRKEAALPRTQF